jgi:two-component system response regulator PilR (NtrC family)
VDGVDLNTVLAGVEARYIERALELSKGNVTQASRMLGLQVRTLRYRMKILGIKINRTIEVKNVEVDRRTGA